MDAMTKIQALVSTLPKAYHYFYELEDTKVVVIACLALSREMCNIGAYVNAGICVTWSVCAEKNK